MNLSSKIGSHYISDLCKEFGTPLYLYDAQIVRQRIKDLKKKVGIYKNTEFLYAIKANFNPHLVRIIVEEGFGIDAVSLPEVNMALYCECPADRIICTENNMSQEEIDKVHELGVLVNFNSLSALKRYGVKHPGSRVSVRFNPSVGAGSHETNITGGPKSKFGVREEKLGEVLAIAEEHNLKIVGIHEHIGSGWLGMEEPLMAMDLILRLARRLPDLEFIDCGGGFGVPYSPAEAPLDLETLGGKFKEKFTEFVSEYGRDVKLMFEPGRYVIAEAGRLVGKVTAIKNSPEGRTFVGIDTGMNHLARVALYGSYHPISNVTNPEGELKTYDVCGNVCECADFFAKDREIPEIREGDLLGIDIAGAYGMVMGSNYQLRSLPAEVLVDADEVKLIRERMSFEELLKVFSY